MSATRIAMRAALRPTTRRVQASAQRRLQTTMPGTERGGHATGGPVGNKGTTNEKFKKDGGGSMSNRNLMYIGAAALAVGGMYSMFMAKPEKVGEVAKKS